MVSAIKSKKNNVKISLIKDNYYKYIDKKFAEKADKAFNELKKYFSQFECLEYTRLIYVWECNNILLSHNGIGILREQNRARCMGTYKVEKIIDSSILRSSMCTDYGATYIATCSDCNNEIDLSICPKCKSITFQIRTWGDGDYTFRCRKCKWQEIRYEGKYSENYSEKIHYNES